jgi:hypothetical protein
MEQDLKPSQRIFRVLTIGDEKTTKNGNPYLECETDKGLVAFWGGANNHKNIAEIKVKPIPFTVRCDPWFKSNFSQHAFWIPEHSLIEFLGKEGMPVSDVPEVKISNSLTTPAPISVDELANIRRKIIRIVDSLEKQYDKEESDDNSVARRISYLSRRNYLPREVAAMMRALTEMRNVTEYEAKVLSEKEVVATRANWEVVQEWAKKEGHH